MKSLASFKLHAALVNLATVSSRFSLGAVLAFLPLLVAHYFGNELAKNVALAINLSSYSSWLALGGYSTVMRDFRLAKNAADISSLNNVYRRLASMQCVGAIILTTVIATIFVLLSKPYYLKYSSFVLSLIFGTIVQCSSFWLNLVLGRSYSKNKFIGVGLNVSILRFTAVIVVIFGSYLSNELESILIVTSVIFILSSIILYRFSTSTINLPINTDIQNNKQLKVLFIESIIYFKWSLFATAVFLLPVSAIAAIAPNLLLPATVAFFLAGANQNLVAAIITPRANSLLDGIGSLKILKSYYHYTINITLIVTLIMLLMTWLIGYFVNSHFKLENYYSYLYLSMALVAVSGVRALTLASTQAAITLKMERLVMLSPLLESAVSILGIAVCWYLNKGSWIVGVFLLAVVVILIVTISIESAQISNNWKRMP